MCSGPSTSLWRVPPRRLGSTRSGLATTSCIGTMVAKSAGHGTPGVSWPPWRRRPSAFASVPAFDIPFDHRAARFAEAFEIIRRLLAGERVTFDGRFERVHDAVVLPRPVPPPPLMIGSTGERVLRVSLAHVDAWNVWYDSYGNTPEGFARANTRVSELIRESGRNPSDVLRSATVFVTVEGGGRDRPHTLDAPPLSGPPHRIANGLADLAAAGLDEAILVVTPITERAIRVLCDTPSHRMRARPRAPASLRWGRGSR
jgi:alkanesulfonate monooxygenase SsuD/methylene tetrahydromethanopterin reductase-like flavin-dependent oxidoreductase (luciferase family)